MPFSPDQVADVEEGDIVKTNGDLLYYVTHNSNGLGEYASYLSIVNVQDPNSPQLVSTTGFENRIHDIFLGDNRAAVILDQSRSHRWMPEITGPNTWPAFGRSSSLPGDNKLELVVLDVTNAAEPGEVYRATIDGDYIEARLIGDELYIVSNTGNPYGPSPWLLFNDESVPLPDSPGDYIDAILESPEGFGLPTITIEANGVTKSITVGMDQVVNREGKFNSTLITTFDLQSLTGNPVDMDLVDTGHIATVYVSTNAMYLFDGDSVVKFSFLENAAGVEFAADGQIGGSLINQFAADEHEGYLRVAITDWSDRSSDVLVLNQVDDAMVLVSSLENIAPNESIFAVHFTDDQAFIVTFRVVDPLFVIDLSNPADPKITGALKIPGVSNYLQLIGEDLLLSVGRDADEVTGRFGALQVSLFDVSDPEAPVLLHRYSFEGGNLTQTLATWEHRALTYDANTGILSLPIFWNPGWTDEGMRIFQTEGSAISLLQIDRENGISEAGRVDFDDRALRTAIVGEHLIYLSGDSLKTATRTSPSEILATMDFPTDLARIARPIDPAPIQPPQPTLPPSEEREVAPVAKLPHELPELVAPVTFAVDETNLMDEFVYASEAYIPQFRGIAKPISSNGSIGPNGTSEQVSQQNMEAAFDGAFSTGEFTTELNRHETYRSFEPSSAQPAVVSNFVPDPSTLDSLFAEFDDRFESATK